MINENHQPRPAADLLWREIDEGVVLITPDGRIQALNQTASDLWRLVAAGQTITEMKSFLLSKYDIQDSEAEADILTFLDELTGAGMITWQKSAP